MANYCLYWRWEILICTELKLFINMLTNDANFNSILLTNEKGIVMQENIESVKVDYAYPSISRQFQNGFSIPQTDVEKMERNIKKIKCIVPAEVLARIKEKARNVNCWSLTLKCSFVGKGLDGMHVTVINPCRIHEEQDYTLYVQDMFTGEWFCLKSDEEMGHYTTFLNEINSDNNILDNNILISRSTLLDILHDDEEVERNGD